MKPIEVIQPKTKADLDRCLELDKQGKLASGSSYPTAEQFEAGEKKDVAKAIYKIAKNVQLVEETK